MELPSLSILQYLLESAKSNSAGLVIFVRRFHHQLQEDEDICLRKLLMHCKNDRPEDLDEIGFPSSDNVKRAQLQAIIRRLQGIVSSLSRIPTFQRRFKNLVKLLYMEAIEIGLIVSYANIEGATKFGHGNGSRCSNGRDDSKDGMQVLRMSLAFSFGSVGKNGHILGEQPLSKIAIHKAVLALRDSASIQAKPDLLGLKGEDTEWVAVNLQNSQPSNDDWVAVFSPAKFK
nr:uncharacterized membrane protein At3g27390 [Ipomoea batatas]